MSAPALTPAATLRQARKARRLSQLELSMRLGVSQGHVSFVEGGRSRPSRELLAAWLEELEVPLPVRNEALLQAGYAPAYGAARLDDPALERARHALDRLLAAHDPLPALVLDAQWNLLRLNRGGRWLAATLAPGLTLPDEGPAVNLLDLLAHPEGLTTRIVNLHEVGPAMLAHVRHAAGHHAGVAAGGAHVRRRRGHASRHRLERPVNGRRYTSPREGTRSRRNGSTGRHQTSSTRLLSPPRYRRTAVLSG